MASLLTSLSTAAATTDALPSAAADPSAPPEAPPALKNGGRVDEIRSRMIARHTVTLRTSYCSRHLRRDFNIASAKMYVYGLQRGHRDKIAEALKELHWQISLLSEAPAMIMIGPIDVSWLTAETFEFVMVSPESASMYRALRNADNLVARILAGERAGIVTRDQRRALIAPVNMAYVGFKQVAMRLAAKSVEDLLSEANLA
jgi:hypothetical protein